MTKHNDELSNQQNNDSSMTATERLRQKLMAITDSDNEQNIRAHSKSKVSDTDAFKKMLVKAHQNIHEINTDLQKRYPKSDTAAPTDVPKKHTTYITDSDSTKSQSKSEVTSTSETTSEVASTATSENVSESEVASTAKSETTSEIASTATSEDVSESEVASTATSENVNESEVANTATSETTSEVASTATSETTSEVASTATSENVNESEVASTATSEDVNESEVASTSTSEDVSESEVASTAASEDVSESESLTDPNQESAQHRIEAIQPNTKNKAHKSTVVLIGAITLLVMGFGAFALTQMHTKHIANITAVSSTAKKSTTSTSSSSNSSSKKNKSTQKQAISNFRQSLQNKAKEMSQPHKIQVKTIGGGYLMGVITYYPNDPTKTYMDYSMLSPVKSQAVTTDTKATDINKQLSSTLPTINKTIKVKDKNKVTINTYKQSDGTYQSILLYDKKPFGFVTTKADGSMVNNVTTYYIQTVEDKN